MNQKENHCEESNEKMCDNRREFLVKTTAVVGGIMLGLSGAVNAQKSEDDKSKMPIAPDDEFVLKLDDKSPLSKIGGFDTFDTKSGKVVVVRTSETDFKAYSAVCPHKGGPIKYDEKTSQLFCPWHGSRFTMTGAVIKGPAKTDLPLFTTEKAVVVNLKTKS